VELEAKLDRISDMDADVAENRRRVLVIASEISGQVRGNDRLKAADVHLLTLVEKFVGMRGRLNNTHKSDFVGEFRERLRNVDISNFSAKSGVQDE
jgi:hypothetical protein